MEKRIEKAIGAMEQLGHVTIEFIEETGRTMQLAFNTVIWIFSGRINLRLVLEQMVKIGVDSLPIALTSAAFVGMVFAVQIATEFVRFGASKYVGGVMGIAVARELAPALTGIVISSRVAASIAAEIGTMKVTEQIDALNAMGSSPVSYLVIPRFIACTLMLPLLTVLADLLCFFGGYFVSVYLIKINAVDYINSAQQLLVFNDIYGGIFKSFIFGMIISVIACNKGLRTQGGAKGVGEATTSAVVSSLIALFIANYFLSVMLFK
ncbi:MAG TPA: ABC transporter permease [Candidatus Omnitrophota bacterium]|nr:ABC transporter permease [Candidatus Omnitrophota bacterium]